MAGLYARASKVWHRLPQSVQRVIVHTPPLSWIEKWLIRVTIRSARHDEIYDADYYADRCADESARLMADSLLRHFAPSRVLDVGCGTGDLLGHLRRAGVDGTGLEYSRAALEICADKGLPVLKFDLERDDVCDLGDFDLAVSMEVAEHLPESSADRFVDLLCSASETVVFTAATPGQGGTDHVNEQPHAYWLEKFSARGYELDRELSLALHSEWKQAGTESWYFENVMVVCRRHLGRGGG